MYKIWHTKNCRYCGSDFTESNSIKVHFSTGEEEFDLHSRVTRRGQLIEVSGLIAAGHHAGSSCVACGEQIEDELAPKEKQGITYRELLNRLLQAPNCELEQDVMVYLGGLDEFYPVTAEIKSIRYKDKKEWLVRHLIHNDSKPSVEGPMTEFEADRFVSDSSCAVIKERVMVKELENTPEELKSIVSTLVDYGEVREGVNSVDQCRFRRAIELLEAQVVLPDRKKRYCLKRQMEWSIT